MTAGDARHGRRDNGLSAAQYAAAGDVDPRIGEHLLDVLAINGIAAYLRPSADVNPVTRSSILPNRPTDRLYVDRAHLAAARDYLARLAADADSDPVEADTSTDDDLWAAIVAGYDTEPDERPWPEAEDLAPTPRPEDSHPSRAGAARTGNDVAEPEADPVDAAAATDPLPTAGTITPVAPVDEADPPVHRFTVRFEDPRRADRASTWADDPSLLDGLDSFGTDLPDADDEGYTPPEPPPIPRPSLPTALGVIGIVGGLIVFLRPDLLPIAQSVAMLLGFTAVVAGFGTLVWRLRPGDEDDDIDPDEGARV